MAARYPSTYSATSSGTSSGGLKRARSSGGSCLTFRGLSLDAFEAVLLAVGGREAFADKTTSWLKHNHVLDATRNAEGEGGVAYADLLFAKHGRRFVNGATCFLSHSYSYSFVDVVESARAFQLSNPRENGLPHFFYFDLLVVNQHAVSGMHLVSFENLSNEFGRGVRDIGTMAFVLDYANPVSLKRSWCVFEAAQMLLDDEDEDAPAAASTDVSSPAAAAPATNRFCIVMPPQAKSAFTRELVSNFDNIVRVLCAVDVEKAEAEIETDRVCISDVIKENMGGFVRVNQLVIGALRAWMTSVGFEALASIESLAARHASDMQLAFARFLVMQSDFTAADELFRSALAARRAAAEKGQADAVAASDARAAVFVAATSHGDLLWRRGRAGEAVALCREAADGLRILRGGEHVETLSALSTLAVALDMDGQNDAAARTYADAIAGRTRVLGADHADTLTIQSNFGGLLATLGRLDEATELNRNTLAARRRALGNEHVDTLRSLHNLAHTLRRLGRAGEAEPLFLEALAARRRTLGDGHVSTLSTAHELGELLAARGDVSRAAALFEEAERGRRVVLGDSHKDTVASGLRRRQVATGV
jgi:tetratricopeptide (TPR) repeat protein